MFFKIRVNPLPLSKRSAFIEVLTQCNFLLNTVSDPNLGEFVFNTPRGIIKHGLECEFGLFGINTDQLPDILVELLRLIRGQDEPQCIPLLAINDLDSSDV